MKKLSYEEKLARVRKAAEKKEMRLIKRLQIEKGKPKKKSIRLLKQELWLLTSKIVRLREKVCFTCDAPLEYKDRQAGHHFSKGGHPATIFDLRNLHVQNSACNLFKSGNQVEYAYRLRKLLGDQEYEDLYQLANSPYKWTREELMSLIEERKGMLANLTTGPS